MKLCDAKNYNLKNKIFSQTKNQGVEDSTCLGFLFFKFKFAPMTLDKTCKNNL